MVETTFNASKNSKKVPFEAAALVALAIACPGEPNTENYIPTVVNDAELMDVWLRQHGFQTQKLIHTDATKQAITDWFDEQTIACTKLKKTHPNKKFLLFCFYSGHGDRNGGTNRVNLPGSIFALEDYLRKFGYSNSDNSYVVGFLD